MGDGWDVEDDTGIICERVEDGGTLIGGGGLRVRAALVEAVLASSLARELSVGRRDHLQRQDVD